jgi:hypothetical protein
MTRILSEMVGSNEQALRTHLAKLEKVSGHPNADIKLTASVVQASGRKLRDLGLDPQDTTGPELYAALQLRMQADDERLLKVLQKLSKDQDIVASVAHALRNVPIPRECFMIKSTVAKRLLKKAMPKKTMKLLGYRSFDSLLKHEPVAAIYAAAFQVELPAWRKQLFDQYAKLKPSDFEMHDIVVIQPSSARWQKASKELLSQQKHNILSFKELGAVVLLPVDVSEQPQGFTTVSLVLALHAINEIRAAGAFLKLNQVRSDFGTVVQEITFGEPQLTAETLDQPVAWHIIQRYYARFQQAFSDDFELHIQPSDLSWHSIERVLEHLDPKLGFWRGTAHLSLLHARQPVSFNIIDVALAYCNQLPFADRIVHYLRESLLQEILMGYLRHENIEQTIRSTLQPTLATEPELALN